MFKKHLQEMSYSQHLKRNFGVSFHCLRLIGFQFMLGVLHFLHGLFPCCWTDHHYWNL
jgi:hypothetical protein